MSPKPLFENDRPSTGRAPQARGGWRDRSERDQFQRRVVLVGCAALAWPVLLCLVFGVISQELWHPESVALGPSVTFVRGRRTLTFVSATRISAGYHPLPENTRLVMIEWDSDQSRQRAVEIHEPRARLSPCEVASVEWTGAGFRVRRDEFENDFDLETMSFSGWRFNSMSSPEAPASANPGPWRKFESRFAPRFEVEGEPVRITLDGYPFLLHREGHPALAIGIESG